MTKKNLTPIVLVGIFFLMLGLSFASVPLYDLFCRVTGFGGTTQNAENKEIPKIVINQDYKIRFDTNSNGALDWKFYPEKNTINLKPGEVHTVKFFVENESSLPTSGSARFSSGLSVNDFLKRHSLIKITKTGIERLSASVINLAKYENLEGHANSVKIRLKKEN